MIGTPDKQQKDEREALPIKNIKVSHFLVLQTLKWRIIQNGFYSCPSVWANFMMHWLSGSNGDSVAAEPHQGCGIQANLRPRLGSHSSHNPK